MGARGVEACRRAGLPHVSIWHASAAGIAEEGTNSHLGTFTRAAVISEAGSTAADAWGGTHSVYVLRIKSGVDALDLLPRNVHRLILQVAEQDGPREADPREVWAYYRQGATLRQERVASFGTGSGQWKPSSSPYTPLSLHAVVPVTRSAPLVAPHVVVYARVGSPSADFEQPMSQGIYATQAMEGEEPPSSERPVLWGAASTPHSIWGHAGRPLRLPVCQQG